MARSQRPDAPALAATRRGRGRGGPGGPPKTVQEEPQSKNLQYPPYRSWYPPAGRGAPYHPAPKYGRGGEKYPPEPQNPKYVRGPKYSPPEKYGRGGGYEYPNQEYRHEETGYGRGKRFDTHESHGDRRDYNPNRSTFNNTREYQQNMRYGNPRTYPNPVYDYRQQSMVRQPQTAKWAQDWPNIRCMNQSTELVQKYRLQHSTSKEDSKSGRVLCLRYVGEYLYAGIEGLKKIPIWKEATSGPPALHSEIAVAAPVTAMAHTPADGTLLVGMDHGQIQAFVHSADTSVVLSSHTQPIFDIACEASWMLSAGEDNILHLWERNGSNYQSIRRIDTSKYCAGNLITILIVPGPRVWLALEQAVICLGENDETPLGVIKLTSSPIRLLLWTNFVICPLMDGRITIYDLNGQVVHEQSRVGGIGEVTAAEIVEHPQETVLLLGHTDGIMVVKGVWKPVNSAVSTLYASPEIGEFYLGSDTGEISKWGWDPSKLKPSVL